jgi:GntR family transcriptional regulator/MocR family aminotransferase
MDFSPAHLNQAVLADFISEGHFSRHLRRMRALYAERRNVLVEGLQRGFGSFLQIVGNVAGMHLAVTLPKGFHDQEICTRAAQESLWLWPLSRFYIAKPSHQGFLLGFGSTTVTEIPSAVMHLQKILDPPKNLTFLQK